MTTSGDTRRDSTFDDKKTVAYFEQRVREFGDDPKAVDWSGRGPQETRFAVIRSVGIESGDSVLDVGCGQGDLYQWLRREGLCVQYRGVDLTAAMLSLARAKCPGVDFEQCGVLDLEPNDESAAVDWVVSSGIFYLRSVSPYEFMRDAIRRMWRMAGKGVAFNTLVNWEEDSDDGGEFRAEPRWVLQMCRELTPYVVLRADYHLGDLTFYLYRRQHVP